jgi:hypothetical protein
MSGPMEPTQPRLPPVFQGREDFSEFARSATKDLRYFRSDRDKRFLDGVVSSSAGRRLTLPKEEKVWRARVGCEEVKVPIGDRSFTYVDRPFQAHRMKEPPAKWDVEGRANPRGISYLYVASNPNTAIAEVRPWIGSRVSVGEFVAARDINLIDCSKHHLGLISVVGPPTVGNHEDGMWSAIDEAFAKPVQRTEEGASYVPTQILAELFKSYGYDGIRYKSRLDEDGYNLVIFYPEVMRLISCSLYEISSIRFEYVPERSYVSPP